MSDLACILCTTFGFAGMLYGFAKSLEAQEANTRLSRLMGESGKVNFDELDF